MTVKKFSLSIFESLSWSFLSRFIGNISQFVIYLLLARILKPSDFGIVASLAVFINICNMFATAGLGSANIQNKRSGNDGYPTIFYTSVLLSFFFYFVIYISAPYVSNFFDYTDLLVDYLRVYGLTILFTAINALQISELSKNLEFKKIFFCSTVPTLISGSVSIYLAYAGFGIYSLIINTGLTSLISIIFCAYFYIPFPKLSFNFNIARGSMAYSSNMFLASVLDEIYRSSTIIAVGKFYNSQTLGFFNMGRQIPAFVSSTMNATVATVFFPIFSGLQDDIPKGKELLRKSIRTMNVLFFPISCLTILLADDMVNILLTDKWLPSVIYLKIFAIIYGLHHISSTASYYVNALGHSLATLKFEILKKTIGFLTIALTISHGVEFLLWGMLFVAIVSIFINAVPSREYIKYSFKEQMSDTLPTLYINSFLYILFSIIIFKYENNIVMSIGIGFAYIITYSVIIFGFRLKVIDDWKHIYLGNVRNS
ncbi:MAG: lipopolysaccharide biosynthesis protein [Hydrogenophaga sp.]|nr:MULTISPECIES: lipopolysaccharide biosynthesis protein [Comamonadaceae]MDO9145889.1 lipopolysaccharide biosynthesis protein [Rhodoferax sp.]MDP3887630.1 lipopolysaccharide biosynthesis protein [Hydrogenophaga sp.]